MRNNTDDPLNNPFETILTTPEACGPLGVFNARKVLRAILKQKPDLMLEGFKTPRNAYLYPSSRRDMLSNDEWVITFIACRAWLEQREKQITFNQSGTSYGWKHIAERDTGTYIPNGVFIAAAIAEEFRFQRVYNTPNVLLNIARKRPRRDY
jgi:hypothetical protein